MRIRRRPQMIPAFDTATMTYQENNSLACAGPSMVATAAAMIGCT